MGLPSPETARPAASLSPVTDADFWGFASTVLGEWLAVGVVGGAILALLARRRRRAEGGG